MRNTTFIYHFLLCLISIPATTTAQIVFIEEPFENSNFASRGWYDNTNMLLTDAEHIDGSTRSAEFRFLRGAQTPTSGNASRLLFTPVDSIYVSYYVKYSANWEGSNRSYHPHEFYLLTTEDGNYTGPAYTHLTAYVEQNEGEPLLNIQDAQNIDINRLNENLVGVTENRAVAGCNGDGDGYGDGNCYYFGGTWRNDKEWRAGFQAFSDETGRYYKNEWHFIEAFFKLNTVSNGVGLADGALKYWYDGELLMDLPRVLFRTGQHPNMKFIQFLIAPYIGDGSPVEQTMWVDQLTLSTNRIQSTPPPPRNLNIKK